VLRIADPSDPSSLNPLLAHDQDTIGFDLLVVQTLVGLSHENRVVPLLVTRVPSRSNGDVSRDGRTIVYHLKHGVRFADGQVLSSADVAFTFSAIMDSRNPVQGQDAYRRVATLLTPDPYTVVVRLKTPWNAAVRELFAQSDFAFGILPAHAFAGTALQGAQWEEHAFGTGPFRVREWRRGDRLLLQPNPYYSPHPKLAGIELRMISDDNATVVALRAREIDAARVEVVQVPALSNDQPLRLIVTPLNGFDYLSLQSSAPPTNDPRVRRAIADALDVPVIERTARGLFGPAGAFLPPVFAWHDASLAPLSQNRRAAAAQLDAAGWRLEHGARMRNGAPLQVLLAIEPGNARLSAIVQRQLAQVGIDVIVKSFPPSAFNGPNGPLRTGAFNLSAQGWIGGADPEQSAIFACNQIGENGVNIARYCNPRFDAFFLDQAITPSETRRAADFSAMQRIVYADMPVIPLDYPRYFDAVAPGVTGFARNMLGYPVDAERWDVR
jgi:peptide/nickel transport system substrate-binding protein